MNLKNALKRYFGNEETINIGWTLATSDEYTITEFFKEDYGEEPNDGDWDVINDSIYKFESHYEDILAEFGSNPREFGHDGNGDLVGDVNVSVDDLITILETGEDIGHGEITLTSSSGRFCVEELDLLHTSVLATLTFYLPEDLYQLI